MTSRERIEAKAIERGWTKLDNELPLQDAYKKSQRTVVFKFDIIGRCIGGYSKLHGQTVGFPHNRPMSFRELERY